MNSHIKILLNIMNEIITTLSNITIQKTIEYRLSIALPNNILQIKFIEKEILEIYDDLDDVDYNNLDYNINNIILCLNGRRGISDNYIWIYKRDFDILGMNQLMNNINIIFPNIIYQIKTGKQEIYQIYNDIDDVVDNNLNYKKYHILDCLNKKQGTAYNYGWIFNSDFDKIDMNVYFKNTYPIYFLIDTHPELEEEFDTNLNKGISFSNLTFSLKGVFYWKCKNPLHKPFLCTIYNKTKKDYIRCLDCIPLEKNKDNNIDHIIIGDNTEEYVVDLLKKTNYFKDVTRLGFTGEKSDIKISLNDGTEKGIQIKTLIKDSIRRDAFFINDVSKYDENMLIVMVNQKRDRFALQFVKNIKTKGLTLAFLSGKSKYETIMYRDEESFTKRLIELIPESIDYILDLHITGMMEHKMFQRLESFCLSYNSTFKRNNTDSTDVDLFINKIPCQAKYCSLNVKAGFIYSININKHLGDKKQQPYNINDSFEFVIIEIGGIRSENDYDKTKYHNHFCIIPKSELIIQRILRNDNLDENGEMICKGKMRMCICPPDYPKDHWSKKYWKYPKIQLIDDIEI